MNSDLVLVAAFLIGFVAVFMITVIKKDTDATNKRIKKLREQIERAHRRGEW